MYVEVSAKTGDNISTIFNNTAQILLGFEITKMEGEEDKNKQENPTINLNQAQQKPQNNQQLGKNCNC